MAMSPFIYIYLAAAVAFIIPFVIGAVQDRIHDTRSRLRLLASVVRAAAAWAHAERALRNRQSTTLWKNELFEEGNHRLSLRCDMTEQDLLDAVEKAESEGLNLPTFTSLS